jgi:hypothetical protein
MNRLLFLLTLIPGFLYAQSFHPAPGTAGTNAISKDSSCFVAWASGGTIARGYINISDTTSTASGLNRASFGNLSKAFGPATGSTADVVSLGDSGIATLTFDQFILDGPGYDFAVFENGFTDNYMELAHVEVSSDGIHFFRFPSTSEIPLDVQTSNASYTDCRMVNNLAGKYRAGYGTPFDLSELPDDINLNKYAVKFVRIIDAIGAISGHTTTDHSGHIINDPYPTAFESGGFDLEAIGIINATLGSDDQDTPVASVFPNPATDHLQISLTGEASLQVFSPEGRFLFSQEHVNQTLLSLENLSPGIYHLQLIRNGKSQHIAFIKK